MLPFRRYGTPGQFALPGAGARALFYGDSISDLNYRHWANQLIDRYGWTPVNQTYLQNGNFETNVTGFAAEVNCTVSQNAFSAPLAGSFASAHSASMVATAAGTCYANFGTGMSNFMEAGNSYLFSAWVNGATGSGPPADIFLQFNSTGSPVPSANSASLTALSTWTHLAVVNTVGPSATDAFLRLVNTSAPIGSSVLIDGAELRRVGSSFSTVHEDWNTRSAISGTTLQSNGGAAGNGTDNFAARVAAYGPLDIIIVAYGINDLYGAGAGTTTPATWKAAVATCIANIQAMAGPPKIVWIGLTNSQDTWTAPSAATWGGGLTGPDGVARRMDAITRAAVMAAGGIFVPMRPWEDQTLIDVGANARHPIKPYGENWMFQRIVHFLDMGF